MLLCKAAMAKVSTLSGAVTIEARFAEAVARKMGAI
jgi:hypothetical protein